MYKDEYIQLVQWSNISYTGFLAELG